MYFNDITNGNGIVQEMDDICSTDNNSFPIKSKTRRVNQAQNAYFSLAMQTDGKWEEDDRNFNDYPIATTDLEIGKKDYTFPNGLLEIIRVEVKNSDGKWVAISPIDQSNLAASDLIGTPSGYIGGSENQSLSDFMNINGEPVYYDKQYSSIWLYPASNVNIEKGLKIYYNRTLKELLPTDTTIKLGIPEIHNEYIARKAALPFLVEKGKVNKNDIAQLIQLDEEAIKEYYSRRSRDERTVLRASNTFRI